MMLSAPIHQLKRRAKLMARQGKMPLHAALDLVAQKEGFAAWSLLSAQAGTISNAHQILPRLAYGDMLLVAARPGQGKTLLGLKLLLDAVHDGRRGVFFTLEYTLGETQERIRSLQGDASGDKTELEIITSDEISADYIIRHLVGASPGTIAVIDYLQILDQRRDRPELSAQVDALRAFAKATGIIVAFISQIDRSFQPTTGSVPGMQDIRLPNKIDLSVFSKACFLHAGKTHFQTIG